MFHFPFRFESVARPHDHPDQRIFKGSRDATRGGLLAAHSRVSFKLAGHDHDYHVSSSTNPILNKPFSWD